MLDIKKSHTLKFNIFIVSHRICTICTYTFFFFSVDSAVPYSHNTPSSSSCVNWNQYYTNCTQLGGNPFQGTISFDNIGLAWVAIFLVIIALHFYF